MSDQIDLEQAIANEEAEERQAAAFKTSRLALARPNLLPAMLDFANELRRFEDDLGHQIDPACLRDLANAMTFIIGIEALPAGAKAADLVTALGAAIAPTPAPDEE